MRDMAGVGLRTPGAALLRHLAVEDNALGVAEVGRERGQRVHERGGGHVDGAANVALEERVDRGLVR